MKHTFIFEEGKWQGKGTYSDDSGQLFSLVGETNIIHGKDFWINKSKMIIDIGQKNQISIQNVYKIVPFRDGHDITKWASENQYLGKMNGTFVVVGESILSIYSTENGEFIGTESMFKINNSKYKSFGALLRDSKKVSSWWVEFIKIKS